MEASPRLTEHSLRPLPCCQSEGEEKRWGIETDKTDQCDILSYADLYRDILCL